jgi:cobalt-zinc-cadmium efflux system protein
MSHDDHHEHGHRHLRAGKNRRRLELVLALTAAYVLVDVAGALWTHSLALLAEAGHMLTDATGLALALFAVVLAERPATPERTYGYYRAEILAALANSVLLAGLSLYVLFEAVERFAQPPRVASGTMLLVAVFGLAVNLVGVALLREGSGDSLSMRSAYYEVLADMASAIGVIAAAVVMWRTGWYYLDPLVSAGIGLFILPRTWRLLTEAVGVLLEGTPSDVSLAGLRQSLSGIDGVAAVHDLHVWSLASGVNAMSVHVVRSDGASHDDILAAVQSRAAQFKVQHATVQVETACASEDAHE